MKLLTANARVVCQHRLGRVIIPPTLPVQPLPLVQTWVTVAEIPLFKSPLLVEGDPVGKPILGCPNQGGTIMPCKITLPPKAGYSDWIKIDGRPVCLDSLSGLTDGTPQGLIKYLVEDPGQHWITEAA